MARQFVILRRVKLPFLIDTDTASDDAVALIMALRSPQIQVLAITTVAGNVDVHQATGNALYTAGLCDSKVPVFVGAEQPLKRARVGADWFHGRDGLGDHGYPPPHRPPERQSASDAIIDTIESQLGLVMVTLGPLTNVALALQKKPGIAAKVSRCVVMGGAPCCEGNVIPAAEYNIWCDPEAARIVLRSGLPIELVGWHLCRGEAVVNPSDIQQILSFDTPVAKFAVECNSRGQEAFLEQTGEHGISLPDPVAMAVALDESIVTSQSEHFVDVETESELTRGMTVVDRLNVADNERNRDVWAASLAAGHKAKVIWTIDNVRWKKTLCAALS
ncbi:MAG TPA: nucleoside hydrolase [Verrucomicrobiae bacterium]|nr:nucleoside hydrolase [Verrucomicrobiae bacterium]